MMNRSSKEMGAIETEDRRFRELFGVGPLVALAAFAMINELGLLPDGGTLQHFLWALCFLKVYPTKQSSVVFTLWWCRSQDSTKVGVAFH
jgi:hypothetical protein